MSNILEPVMPMPDMPPLFVCNGNKILAVSKKGEALHILKPLEFEIASFSKKERGEIARSLAEALSFLHSDEIFLGSDIHQDNVLLLQSQDGLTAVFKTEKTSPTPMIGNRMAKMTEDHVKLADLLSFLWLGNISGSNTPTLNFTQEAFVAKLRDSEWEGKSTWQVCKDVVFWTDSKVMDFLTSVSEVLELKQEQHRLAIENHGEEVVGSSWLEQLDHALQVKVMNDSEKRRAYDWSSIKDLLRMIRNYACHYYNLTQSIRNSLGPFDELAHGWTSLFPRLLLHLYQAMEQFKHHTNCQRLQKFYM